MLEAKVANARPARIEASVPHVSAALDAKQAAPIARAVQKTFRYHFEYNSAPQA
jgi:hypothetical protein